MLRLIRILRLSRSSRAMRLLRLFPSLYPLQFLMLSCTNSLPALLWTSMVVAMLLFFCSIIFTSGVALSVSDVKKHDRHCRGFARLLWFHADVLADALSFLGEAGFQRRDCLVVEGGRCLLRRRLRWIQSFRHAHDDECRCWYIHRRGHGDGVTGPGE